MHRDNGVTRGQGIGTVGAELFSFNSTMSAVAGTSRSGVFVYSVAISV